MYNMFSDGLQAGILEPGLFSYKCVAIDKS